MARSTSRGSEGEREAAEARELSLEEVLRSYEQPLNEEQAWAVCYQCCRGERAHTARYRYRHRAKGPDSILLHRDGTVTLRPDTRTCTGRVGHATFHRRCALPLCVCVCLYTAVQKKG